jgi:hypothetical protein
VITSSPPGCQLVNLLNNANAGGSLERAAGFHHVQVQQRLLAPLSAPQAHSHRVGA